MQRIDPFQITKMNQSENPLQQRLKPSAIWVLGGVAGWMYMGAVLLVGDAILTTFSEPLIGYEALVGWTYVIVFLGYAMIQGFIHSKAPQLTQRHWIWILSYPVSVVAGFFALLYILDLWIDFDPALIFAFTIGPGLGTGLVQFLLLRKEYRFAYLLVPVSSAGMFLGVLVSSSIQNSIYFPSSLLVEIMLMAAAGGAVSCLPAALLFFFLPRRSAAHLIQ